MPSRRQTRCPRHSRWRRAGSGPVPSPGSRPQPRQASQRFPGRRRNRRRAAAPSRAPWYRQRCSAGRRRVLPGQRRVLAPPPGPLGHRRPGPESRRPPRRDDRGRRDGSQASGQNRHEKIPAHSAQPPCHAICHRCGGDQPAQTCRYSAWPASPSRPARILVDPLSPHYSIACNGHGSGQHDPSARARPAHRARHGNGARFRGRGVVKGEGPRAVGTEGDRRRRGDRVVGRRCRPRSSAPAARMEALP